MKHLADAWADGPRGNHEACKLTESNCNGAIYDVSGRADNSGSEAERYI